MIRLLEALRSKRTDEGFTLVEAVVSMVILALLTTGIVAGTNTITRMTQDNRSRQIAVNLAQRQLDIDRGILDPLKISSFGTCPNGENPAGIAASPTTISGRVYTVSQCSSLVSTTGNDITCGSGSTISFRRISVTVDWTGRLATTTKVQSDTILSPNGRINDSSTGSIAVQVTGASGTGEEGVSVQISPNGNGAMALQAQPAPTNVDGCTYALGVTPGTYKVTISSAGSVDTVQVAAPHQDSTSVVAGATAPVNFTYDQAVDYAMNYASASPTVPGTALLPNSMSVSFLTGSSTKPYVTSGVAPASVSLFPYPTGYTALAGAVVDTNGNTICAANDPAAWTPGVYGGRTLTSGLRGNTDAEAPGGDGRLAVPMGTFTVRSSLGVYLTAVQQSPSVPTTGQPGCATPQTFKFSQLTIGSTVKLALPYGTYKIYSGTVLGALTTLVGTTLNVTPLTDSVNGALSTFTTSSSTLTLDPRPAA